MPLTGRSFAPAAGVTSFDPQPPDPQIVGLYITAQPSGSRPGITRDHTDVGRGWIEFFPDMGVLVTLRGKTGWREVEIGRGSSDATCPVVALQAWLKFARIAHGPLFRRVTGQGETVGAERLNDQEVARLVNARPWPPVCAAISPEASGNRSFWPFAARVLSRGRRALCAKSSCHASAEMTRKDQRRRDRFRVNLTKARGL